MRAHIVYVTFAVCRDYLYMHCLNPLSFDTVDTLNANAVCKLKVCFLQLVTNADHQAALLRCSETPQRCP